MQNILAGHTNSYHTYTLDQALEGISKAGFKYVELSRGARVDRARAAGGDARRTSRTSRPSWRTGA